MPELDDQRYEQIKKHCSVGDRLAESKLYDAAIGEYNKAWEFIPEPKNYWSASTWVLTAIGDAAFLGGYLASAREALQYAMTCPDAVGNPFLHLRLGEVLHDLANPDAAADELMRAYMAGGDEIFAAEDPRYRQFLATRADLSSAS